MIDLLDISIMMGDTAEDVRPCSPSCQTVRGMLKLPYDHNDHTKAELLRDAEDLYDMSVRFAL